MLKDSYDALASPEDATKWFGLLPITCGVRFESSENEAKQRIYSRVDV